MTGLLAAVDAAYADLGIALGLGLLLGLQRERRLQGTAARGIAGARTFPIVALLGGISVLASGPGVPWLGVAGFVAVAALTVVGYLRTTDEAPRSVGLTTEALLLLTYVLGVLAVEGHREVAIVVGATALLLTGLKERLHRFAGGLSNEDETAALKFVAVALLLVPILPNEDLGPFGSLNPHTIGWMVVLVAGISFAGYVAVKVAGAGRGLLVTGLLGGLVSSTATTVALARRSREAPELSPALAAGAMGACAILYPRVLILVAVAQPAFLGALWPYLAAMAAVTVIAAVSGLVAMRRSTAPDLALKNPFELKPAIIFALVFAVVVLASRAAEHWFGSAGLYVAGGLAGLTDMDAITITAARLFGGDTPEEVLARTVAIASMANALVKAGIALSAGSRPFGIRVAVGLLLSVAAGVLSVILL